MEIQRTGKVLRPHQYYGWLAKIIGHTDDTGGFFLYITHPNDNKNCRSFFDNTEEEMYKQIYEAEYIEIRWTKYVLLSADGYPSVYSMPDIVADNLEEYCITFCKKTGSRSFNETDFVKYIGELFPDNQPQFVETLNGASYRCKNNRMEYKNVPKKYQSCKWFNF